MKKFYFIYKTTNIKNNKFYIGVHETFNINDGYIGSGKLLKRSVKYHGSIYFTREILEYFSNTIDMYNREKEIVTANLLKDPKCMNIALGGNGGFTQERQVEYTTKSRKAQAMLKATNKEWVEKRRKAMSASLKNAYNTGKKKVTVCDWTGKKHTNTTKLKIGKANSKYSGNKNSQYGTRWITDGVVNKKINKDMEIPCGFKLGRTLNGGCSSVG